MRRARFQRGSLGRVHRKGGREVWVFRWRDTAPSGKRRHRMLVVGSVRELKTETAAWQALERLHLNINLDLSEEAGQPASFGELIAHYKTKELVVSIEGKAASTRKVYNDNLRLYILPRWRDYSLYRFEKGIAVHVEEWLKTLMREDGEGPLARTSKAKIRNIMSAVCSHAIRYGWMKNNPIHAVRQSAKRQRTPDALTVEELQGLFANLKQRGRMLLMLDVPTGMRVGELLALKWEDIDFEAKTVNICKSIWHQHLGPVKTEGSERVLPLDDAMIADLLEWRAQTSYTKDTDWIFASERMHGRQPLWPENLMKNHIRKAAIAVGIAKHVTWNVFRHTFSTLLMENGENVKTVQALMRHANSRITLEIYTRSVDNSKREAQTRVVEMIKPSDIPAGLPVMPAGNA